MKRRKARSGQNGFCEFNKNDNFNPAEVPATIMKGCDYDGNFHYEKKAIGDNRTVECYKFQHKQARRKGLRNLKALRRFLLERV